MHEDAAAAIAALACIEADAEHRRVERSVAGRQSGKTICGFLPPSSSDTFFSVCAELAIVSLPTRGGAGERHHVDIGVRDSGSPTSGPVPTRMLTTPAGQAGLRRRISPSITVEPEVSSDGLTTAVQPAASAKGSFWLTIRNGKFHGVMIETTPIGSRSTTPSVGSPSVL